MPGAWIQSRSSSIGGRCRTERRDCCSNAAFGTVASSRARLIFAMPVHLGGVSGRLAVPRIVVLGKATNNMSQFVKQYRNLCLGRIPFVGRSRQQTEPTGSREHSSWVQLHDNRSAVEEWSVSIQYDRRVLARILHRPGRPWVLEEMSTFGIYHVVHVRRSFQLQLEVQRPKQFGGVRISFVEPCGARVVILQNVEDLLTRPNDCVAPFAQG